MPISKDRLREGIRKLSDSVVVEVYEIFWEMEGISMEERRGRNRIEPPTERDVRAVNFFRTVVTALGDERHERNIRWLQSLGR